jgi:tetratricopeptide (TPR) repeat protein
MCLAIANGQNFGLIRDLKKDLATAKGENQYQPLAALAWEYRAAYPDSGIYYGQRAYQVGEIFKRKDLAMSLNFIGLCYHYKGDNLVAYDYYNKALKVSRTNKDSLQIGHANNNIGRLFMEQGLLKKGHQYLLAGRDIFDDIGDLSGWAYSLQSLGSYYNVIKNQQQAEKNFLEAYRIRVALGNTKEIVSALLQIGKFFLATGRVDDGLAFFQKADSAGRIINDPIILAETKVQLAECMIAKGNLELAEIMANEALKEITKSNNVRLLPEAYLAMGQIQHKKGDLNKAKEYYNLTLGVSTSRRDLNNRMEAYFLLWQSSKKAGAELGHYTNYMMLKDSIREMELHQREAQLNFQKEIARRDAETEILELQQERKTAVIVGLVLIIISVSVILFQLIRNRKKILAINQLLEERNAEINRINHELEDRVKQRTEVLEIQNKRLAEYAFINSHLLRGPVSRILGLINLVECDESFKEEHFIDLLRNSGNELDAIVKKITEALNDKDILDLKDLQ